MSSAKSFIASRFQRIINNSAFVSLSILNCDDTLVTSIESVRMMQRRETSSGCNFTTFLVSLSLILTCTCDFKVLHKTEHAELVTFYVFPNTTVPDAETPVAYPSESVCYSQCKKTTCSYFVVHKEKGVQCSFGYAELTKSERAESNATLITTQKVCGNICRYLTHLCGPCKCIDMCNLDTRLRFRCDCTKVVKVMESCKELRESGFTVSGRYLIDPDGTKDIAVSCFMSKLETSNRNLTCHAQNGRYLSSYSHIETIGRVASFDECRDKCFDLIAKGSTYTVIILTSSLLCYCSADSTRTSESEGSISCVLSLEDPRLTVISESRILMMAREMGGDGIFWKPKARRYINGFGVYDGEFWLGLNNIHRITSTFHTDLKVVMVSNKYKDTITTVYENVLVKGEADAFEVSYTRFNSMGARQMVERFHIARLENQAPFQHCSMESWWCISCTDGRNEPTRFSPTFAFGDAQVDSIVFYLITKKKKRNGSIS